jgi:ribA/ribD-fused uncharacterized protein
MTKVSVNDMVQWTAGGVDQFAEPKKVRIVSDCGEYCFVEGGNTGLPVGQVTVVVPARETEEAPRAEYVEPDTSFPEVELHVVSEFIPVRGPLTIDIPQPEDERFTFFWHGPFSQWHRCRFTVNGVLYNCAEQYMMAGKARLFTDFNALQKIMAATDPSIHKKVGRAVRGFDEGKWNAVAKEVVYNGNHAKFTQNPTLLKALLDTYGTTLVEASPYDKIWGIGMHATDRNAQRRATWQGKNWLGEVLTQLRNDLCKKG